MLKKISKVFVNIMQKFLPDAFIFCIILTIVVFVAAMPLTGQGPIDMIRHWGNGFWGLLSFAMQMALVVVLGTAFATAPAIRNFLGALAKLPKSPFQAIFLVTFVSTIACWLNWGFGLIVGALFAKEIAKVMKKVDYRLLIASAYSGFVVWHAGFSGSIQLQLAGTSEGELASTLKNTGGAITSAIPISETILAPWNIIVCVAILVVISVINGLMHPAEEDTFVVDPSVLHEETREYPKATTPAQSLENSPVITYIIVAMGVAFTVWQIATKRFNLNLNVVNFIFLILGMAFHVTPIRYAHAIGDAAKGAAGVLIQFPFYAGIQGMMVGVSAATGLTLAGVISNAFVAISNHITFPLFTFWSAGIVNFFVPSGGGQWTVQGPIIMPAANELGVSPALAANAIAWGDAWTNMVQPFWALPALGFAKLSAKDIMGYCTVVLIVTGIIISLGLLITASMGGAPM